MSLGGPEQERSDRRATLRDLGESGLLRRIFPLLPSGAHTLLGPGDDAAVVAAPDSRVVVTTDVMVEGRDFRRDWSTAQDVGAKAAAQNLADIAAMGAVPTALVVALVAPLDLDPDWATGLTEGLVEGCAGTGAGVVGGDLSRGAELMVAITALGDLQDRTPVTRDGAAPGQVVAVAGVLGHSAAGLALLQAGYGTRDMGADAPSERTLSALVAAHRRPAPPYAAGPAAAHAGATAMLDLSDGLVLDAGRLAGASGVLVELDLAALSDDVAQLRDAATHVDADAAAWVLGGGEDHGLLATFPADEPLPEGFRAIGRTTAVAAGEAPGVLVDGRPWRGSAGWDHFR
ncbi:MAG TPA: thiamine-phosphate kinase [Actinomycetales bacterium]|nr:thiamine-phosphate kinase [Actinomycetales bacterium]